MHPKVRNIPRNPQLRGRLFDIWPRKGLPGACCAPSGEGSGAPTGRGPACSAVRDGAEQGGFCGAGGSAVEPGRDGPAAGREGGHGQSTAAPPPPKGRSGASGAGRGGPAYSAAEPGAQKKRTSVRSLLLFCYTTLLPYGHPSRDAQPMHPAARQRPCTPDACLFCGRQSGDFRQHVLLQQPAFLRFRPARRLGRPCESRCRSGFSRSGFSRSPPGVTAVKAAVIGASAIRRPGRTRESLRHRSLSLRSPPGSQPPG